MFDFISNIFFKNSGKRIQNIAIILFFIQVIFAAIGGIVMFFAGLIDIDDMGSLCFLAPFAVLSAICVAWLDSIFIYGFGELIDNTSKETESSSIDLPTTAPQSKKVENQANDITVSKSQCSSDSPQKQNKTVIPIYYEKRGFYECPECGSKITKGQKHCLCPCDFDWSKYM